MEWVSHHIRNFYLLEVKSFQKVTIFMQWIVVDLGKILKPM